VTRSPVAVLIRWEQHPELLAYVERRLAGTDKVE
jgi:hypothetical protein